MNINFFFIFIFIGLISIYHLFKPIHIENQDFIDIPLFEMSKFTLYELNSFGLTTLMEGKSTIRYSDRYSVSDINFTDNSQEYLVNIVAGNGVYKEKELELKNNIIFSREDGLSFKTEKATYDKDTNTIKTVGKYYSSIGNNTISGDSLTYYNIKKRIESKNIVAIYQLGEYSE